VPIIAIYAIVAAVIFSAGFGAGWGVKGWKDGAEVALAESAKDKAESRSAILETANGECQTDIEGVRQGVKVITDAVAEREKAAADAMKNAETLTAKHKATVVSIKALQPVPAAQDAQCAAIVQEQKEYVQNRHSGN
jgi:hypothetical protein